MSLCLALKSGCLGSNPGQVTFSLRASASSSVKWGHDVIYLIRSLGGLHAMIKHEKQGTSNPVVYVGLFGGDSKLESVA